MGALGPTEIILIFLAILLLFGAKRIPEIARGLGKGIREFKDATNDIKRELSVHDTPPPPRIQPPAAPPVQTQASQPAASEAAAPPAPPAPPPAEGQAPGSQG